MTRRYDSKAARQRILSTCVRLFLEQGYSKTVPKQIISEADVTVGSFYNIFKSKSSVLTDLCEFMFENQFGIAEDIVGKDAGGALIYAVETSIQLTLAELNENLREIYVEAYTDPDLLDLIQHKTASKLKDLFNIYIPNGRESDFYEMEIGTSGMIRGYMAKKCDMYFTIEKKLARFLSTALDVYNVPKEEKKQIIDTIMGLDIRRIAENVMRKLFARLEMEFDFKLPSESYNTNL